MTIIFFTEIEKSNPKFVWEIVRGVGILHGGHSMSRE
jgi:hypothetical protein